MSKYSLDANHNDIAGHYKKLGCSVEELARLGYKIDLLVGLVGVTDLVEVKTEDGTPTKTQSEFNKTWRGRPVVTVRTLDDVVEHVNRVRRERRQL